MGLRGPKAVDVKLLQAEAMQWACFFYILRDGQPGLIQHVKWSKVQTLSSMQSSPSASGRGTGVRLKKLRYRKGELLETPILIPVSAAAQELPKKMEAEGWVIYRPIMPKPDVWEQLKKARTVRQIEEAARAIGELQSKFVSSTQWAQNPGGALSHYANGILAAKRLPSYAKTNRPRSDDKRVEFLAKAMAGLTLGIASITAAKRLSHWHWPKDWAESSLKEFVERTRM